MKKVAILFPFFIIVFSIATSAQALKPGFNKAEYIEMLKLNAKHTNPDFFKDVPAPDNFILDYRSETVGLDNSWELWISKDKRTAVISLRGTTEKQISWLENFYAAMVPAKGSLQLDKNDIFEYELAQHPQAAVHVGWLLGVGALSKTVIPKLDSCYKTGVRDLLITGHSQGGALSFLMTAHLRSLQRTGKLPADIRIKTYCGAAPKPGNLYFAYEYEVNTQAGWSYNVVNADDWVPEVPFSIQTTDDFNEVNPFRNAKAGINEQKFPTRQALKHVYKKLDKPTRKAQKNYQKYLGKSMSGFVTKNIPNYKAPKYYNSNNYVRTGNTIVLKGGEDYYKLYPIDRSKIFMHHMFDPYLYLANQLPE